ncbi:gp53-like domain-containing protein [Sphingobium yanoikuyae]|uniref:gp53-like domain-containing protein n=1 Tax=Sphingobium yanoikuyae TaxID=13690 RepID=UPI0026EB2811|nr:hypothetical protein [Sphingobium yanoikuyae]
MHKIDSQGATAAGQFKETPAPATRVDAAWLNAVQAELVNVITSAAGGDAELNKADTGQLLTAILAIIGRNISVTLGATGQIAIAGLVIKWGGMRTPLGEGAYEVNFTPPFPTGCYRLFPVAYNGSVNSEADIWAQSGVTDADSGVVVLQGAIAGKSCEGFDWIAIGH